MVAPRFASGTAWLLVTVTSISLGVGFVIETEPKDRLVGTMTKLSLGPTVCGLPAGLSLIASVPVRKTTRRGREVYRYVTALPLRQGGFTSGGRAAKSSVAEAILSVAFPVLAR